MRILVVQDADWTKKGPHQQHHLIERLSCRGHEITVVGFNHMWRQTSDGIVSKRYEMPNTSRFYEGASVRYVSPTILKMPMFDYLSFLFTSRKSITNMDFEPQIVVGFTSLLSCYWGMKFAHKMRIPFVYYWTDTIHTLVPNKAIQPIGSVIEQHVLRRSDLGLAINERLRVYMDSIAPKTRTEVIPGGVDSRRFDPGKAKRQVVRDRYGLKDRTLLLFFMGWVYEFSGLGEIVTEMAKTCESGQDVRLMVVGDGDYLPKLRTTISGLQLEDRVILTGRRPYDEIPDLISASDICVLPARNNDVMRDIVPIKMYEYLAMHKPVISTRLPGVMKEFPSGSGVLFAENPEHVLELATHLSAQETSSLSAQASQFIAGFQWDSIVDRFEDTLSKLLKS